MIQRHREKTSIRLRWWKLLLLSTHRKPLTLILSHEIYAVLVRILFNSTHTSNPERVPGHKPAQACLHSGYTNMRSVQHTSESILVLSQMKKMTT